MIIPKYDCILTNMISKVTYESSKQVVCTLLIKESKKVIAPLKLIYSEKAKKFREIFTLLLTGTT